MRGMMDNQAHPQDKQVPPLLQGSMCGHVSVVPPPMMNGEIRSAFLNLDPSMTS